MPKIQNTAMRSLLNLLITTRVAPEALELAFEAGEQCRLRDLLAKEACFDCKASIADEEFFGSRGREICLASERSSEELCTIGGA